MPRLRLALWLLIAWPLPALIAGALGWKGVWGSGGALADYLIPIPVAGGALHVPSFVFGAIAIGNAALFSARAAQRWRAVLIGLAGAAALLLFDAPQWRLQENPLALFVLCDALLAFITLGLAPQRPWWRADAVSLVLFLAPLAALAWFAHQGSPSSRSFHEGLTRQSADFTEATLFVHTTLNPNSPKFRAEAQDWAANHHPRQWHNTEDVALHFTPKREAAQGGSSEQVVATLCQYEDGTPSRWLADAGDCFGDHLTFAEMLTQDVAAQPVELPAELRRVHGLRDACARAAPPPPGPPNSAITRVWLCMDLARQLADAAKRFPDAAKPVAPPAPSR